MQTPTSAFHPVPVFPKGFRCASRNVGLKPSARDLTLFVSEVDAVAAAVFTRNHFPGAPVILGRGTLREGRLPAVIANNKEGKVASGAPGSGRAASIYSGRASSSST